jgi:omega-6 fatty acid desaturase (delta-12 desaturase)
MFNDRERWMVLVSDVFFGGALVTLAWLVYTFSFGAVVKFYLMPYLMVNAYLVLITYLQHTDTYIPHFREGEWNWLRGALCTVDRSFGSYLDGVLHHIVDTHVCHHIFSTMPFYHAEEATEALKPLLGRYYLKDPTPIPQALWRSYSNCNYVDDEEKVVFYQKKTRKN